MLKTIVSVGIAASVVVAHARDAAAYPTFYIEENTDFTGNGCQNTDVNTVTAAMVSVLNARGYTGQRWTNQWTAPQDFWEACSSVFGSGGLDSSWGDTALLAVYAGHGDAGKLQWGYQSNGACNADLGNNMRLGSMAGAQTGYAMYLTSCTLRTSSLVANANLQWAWQNMGFHNSPSIYWNASNHVVKFQCDPNNAGTWYRSNVSTWLQFMEKDQAYDETNSPIVVSYGPNAALSEWVRDNASTASLKFVALCARGENPWELLRQGPDGIGQKRP